MASGATAAFAHSGFRALANNQGREGR
jgi:hypothetical protein